MRNYPILKNKNNAGTPINWQRTYVNSLVMHTKSLIDYSNYFLADYRRGPEVFQFMEEDPETHEMTPKIINGFPCFSIEKLKYHQYSDTTEEGWYFLKDTDFPDTSRAKKISSGRHIINNNQKESGLDTYKDWDNIVIQPMGYTAFYIMSFHDGQFLFTFTRNAQLYYGTGQSYSPMTFYTRFFYKDGGVLPKRSESAEDPDIQVAADDYKDTEQDYNWGIIDKQGFSWTDTINNPVMGFLFKKSTNQDGEIDPNDSSIGEEIIVDTKVTHTIEIDKTSSAVYTITALGEVASGQHYYSLGTILYFL